MLSTPSSRGRLKRTLPLANPLWQMLRLDGVAITEGHRPFNGTGQLPDISRERIVPEHPQSDIAELDEPPVMPPAGFFQEVHGQHFHIFIPRSEEHTSELQSRPH